MCYTIAASRHIWLYAARKKYTGGAEWPGDGASKWCKQHFSRSLRDVQGSSISIVIPTRNLLSGNFHPLPLFFIQCTEIH